MLKTFVFVMAVTLLAAGMVGSAEKPPQVSIQELTDPSSPSYVPRPFPKTTTEVIEDCLFHLRKYEQDLRAGRVHWKTLSPGDPKLELYRGLTQSKPTYRFGETYFAKDETARTAHRGYFWVEVLDAKRDQLVGYLSLSDGGLLVHLRMYEDLPVSRLIQSEKEVGGLIDQKFGDRLVIDDLHLVVVRGDLGGFEPLWRIGTTGDTLFLKSHPYTGLHWYRLVRTITLPSQADTIIGGEPGRHQLVVLNRAGRPVQVVDVPDGEWSITDEIGGLIHLVEELP